MYSTIQAPRTKYGNWYSSHRNSRLGAVTAAEIAAAVLAEGQRRRPGPKAPDAERSEAHAFQLPILTLLGRRPLLLLTCA